MDDGGISILFNNIPFLPLFSMEVTSLLITKLFVILSKMLSFKTYFLFN